MHQFDTVLSDTGEPDTNDLGTARDRMRSRRRRAVIDAPVGPFVSRRLLTHERIDSDFVAELTTIVIPRA